MSKRKSSIIFIDTNNLLEKKGILSKAELLEEMKSLKESIKVTQ